MKNMVDRRYTMLYAQKVDQRLEQRVGKRFWNKLKVTMEVSRNQLYIEQAKQQVMKSLQYAYRDRRSGRNGISVSSGLLGSMRLAVRKASPIPVLWTA